MVLPLQGLLEQYFLNPMGLLALLSIVPLVIIYLVRPKPEEMIMPSMRFFRKEKEGGRIRNALNILKRNLMLLFHILFLAGIAAAIANPYITATETPENAVIVLDRSASMQNDFSEAKEFATSNLGERNTLVVVDDEVNVLEEDASRSAVRNRIGSLETEEVGTDIVSGLKTARSYSGTFVVASDLQQSRTDDDAAKTLSEISDNRPVKVMETSEKNNWGFVDAEIGKTVQADVKNYRETDQKVTVSMEGVEKQLEISGGAVRTVRFETSPGRNVLELEEDGFSPDNRLYVSIPEEGTHKVVIISDSGNPYLEKATELINFTEVETVNPPVSGLPKADLYVVGYTDSILASTVSDIEEEIREGKSAVVFAQEGLEEKGFDFLPVESTGSFEERSVEITEPRRISLGDTQVLDANFSGESWSEPREALVRSGPGDGELLFYNIDDRDFNTRFLYPVFWKNTYSELLGRPTVEELNVRTGQDLEAKNYSEVENTGFHEAGGDVYAANLLNERESDDSRIDTGSTRQDTVETERSVRSQFSLLILVMAFIELLYLYRLGDVEW